MIQIDINTVEENITVVELTGDIDASTAPKVSEEILPLATPSCKILINMSNVPYMSSAGLRALLSLYRQTTAQEGKVVLVGLSEELQDTMSVTGFLDFFATAENVESGMATLN